VTGSTRGNFGPTFLIGISGILFTPYFFTHGYLSRRPLVLYFLTSLEESRIHSVNSSRLLHLNFWRPLGFQRTPEGLIRMVPTTCGESISRIVASIWFGPVNSLLVAGITLLSIEALLIPTAALVYDTQARMSSLTEVRSCSRISLPWQPRKAIYLIPQARRLARGWLCLEQRLRFRLLQESTRGSSFLDIVSAQRTSSQHQRLHITHGMNIIGSC